MSARPEKGSVLRGSRTAHLSSLTRPHSPSLDPLPRIARPIISLSRSDCMRSKEAICMKLKLDSTSPTGRD